MTEGRPTATAAGATHPVRRRNPRGQGSRLRDEIMTGAAALLERTGTEDSVTLRAVAREIGITAPSIAAHFADRTEIIDAVVAAELQSLGERLAEAAGSSDDPVEALTAAWRAYLEFGQATPNRYRVLFERRFLPAWERPSKTMRETTPLFGRAVHLMVGLLQACVDEGRSASTDAFTDSVAIWCALHGLVALPSTITLVAMPSSETSFEWPPAERLLDEILHDLGHLRPMKARSTRSKR